MLDFTYHYTPTILFFQGEPQKNANNICFVTIEARRGDTMMVCLTRENSALTVVFTSNGEPPDKPIHEMGGAHKYQV